MLKKLLSVFSFAALAATAGVALADATVQKPWSRATPPTAKNGAAFMTIQGGGAGDRLVSASTLVSERAELHTHIMEGDVARMREVPAIDVPANGAVELKPGSYHVMLIGLKAPLKEGGTFPLTLKFEKQGAVTVDVPVKALGAMGDMGGHGMQHKGH
ncbi:MAG TPA: copper chaperone PCu(A)C [Pelomicrobium sp.]|nr:copper chaperone PCu(A)C [Pelomicrobium sp.]